jgi:hypothetical protein
LKKGDHIDKKQGMANLRIHYKSNPQIQHLFLVFLIAVYIPLGGCKGDSDKSTIRESTGEIVEAEKIPEEEVIIPELPKKDLQNEDCLSFEPSNINFQPDGSGYLVTDGQSRMMVFRSRTDAKLAVETIEFYGFDKNCFAVRPNPGLRYLTVGGEIPTGGFPGEDCIPINNPENLSIRSSSDTLFQIMDGQSIPFSAKNKNEAERIIEIIQHYEARFTCYIGRPNAGMVYLKK